MLLTINQSNLRVAAHVTFEWSFFWMPKLDVLFEGRGIGACHIAILTFHIIHCQKKKKHNIKLILFQTKVKGDFLSIVKSWKENLTATFNLSL